MSEAYTPVVPEQLDAYVTDDFMAVHEAWQRVDLEGIRREVMPQIVETEFGQAAVLHPKGGYAKTVIVGLPHQQAWKASMAIRVQYLAEQQPEPSRLIVLPNNTVGSRGSYNFSDDETRKISGGDMRPYYEKRVRLLETLEIEGEVELTGYSLGAMTALGIASVGSDCLDVRLVNADEAPTPGRTSGELQKDFMASGGWGEQRAAIRDSRLPVLELALSTGRLLADYGRFGLATLLPENRAMRAGMAGENIGELVLRASQAYPEAFIKIGHVAGSLVFRPDDVDFGPTHTASLPYSNLSKVTYDGPGTHLHPTGDNVAAQALMLVHARALAAV